MQAPTIAIAAEFDPAVAGLYAITQRTLGVPMALLGAAVSAVLLGGASATARKYRTEDLMRLFRGTRTALAATSALVVGGIALIAPSLFASAFGEAWREAGLFVRILAPAYTTAFVAASLGSVLEVLELQDPFAARETNRAVAVIGSLSVAHYADATVTATFSWPQPSKHRWLCYVRCDCLVRDLPAGIVVKAKEYVVNRDDSAAHPPADPTKKLRVLLITQGISRVVRPLVASRHDVVAVVESAPRRWAPGSPLRRALLSVIRLMQVLRVMPPDLAAFCKRNRIPYRFMTSSEDAGLEDWIRSHNPDVIVVYSMSRLLKTNIISIPRGGTINLHTSFLPAYRGPNPDFWQYYEMELKPGVTVHYVDEGEDSGDILVQEWVPVELGIRSPPRLDLLVGVVGTRLLLCTLDAIGSGSEVRTRQPKSSPTPRARRLKKSEHRSIINWSAWPIERIWNVLRGTEQWLDCIDPPKSLISGQRWRIGEFQRESTCLTVQEAGTIGVDESGHYVHCMDGKIRLERDPLRLSTILLPVYQRLRAPRT